LQDYEKDPIGIHIFKVSYKVRKHINSFSNMKTI